MFTDATTAPEQTPTQFILAAEAERLYWPLRRIMYTNGKVNVLASWFDVAASNNHKDGDRILRTVKQAIYMLQKLKFSPSDRQVVNYALTEFVRFSIQNKLIRLTAQPYTKPKLRRALYVVNR